MSFVKFGFLWYLWKISNYLAHLDVKSFHVGAKKCICRKQTWASNLSGDHYSWNTHDSPFTQCWVHHQKGVSDFSNAILQIVICLYPSYEFTRTDSSWGKNTQGMLNHLKIFQNNIGWIWAGMVKTLWVLGFHLLTLTSQCIIG